MNKTRRLRLTASYNTPRNTPSDDFVYAVEVEAEESGNVHLHVNTKEDGEELMKAIATYCTSVWIDLP